MNFFLAGTPTQRCWLHDGPCVEDGVGGVMVYKLLSGLKAALVFLSLTGSRHLRCDLLPPYQPSSMALIRLPLTPPSPTTLTDSRRLRHDVLPPHGLHGAQAAVASRGSSEEQGQLRRQPQVQGWGGGYRCRGGEEGAGAGGISDSQIGTVNLPHFPTLCSSPHPPMYPHTVRFADGSASGPRRPEWMCCRGTPAVR